MYLENTEGNGVSRTLRWGLLIYETLRLVVFIQIMTGGTGEGEFPSMIFGASNALFPLMALFLLTDFHRYGAYAPLYAAGKVLSVLVLCSAAVLWRDRIIQSILLKGIDFLYRAGGLAAVVLGDTVSAICGGFLALRWKKAAQDSSLNAADHGGL
jgi:hypothetical protein